MAVIPVWHGHISDDGRLGLLESERVARQSYLSTLAGKDVEITVRRKRRDRSPKAHRYYFGVVVAIMAEHCGYDVEEMHELLAMRFLRIEDDPKTGSPRRKHLPETDSEEFGEYVDRCIRFGTVDFGLHFPAPGEVAA
ncbi:MAG: hypothetical protein ABI665_09365 [Vicinamibacterales bacterium]